MRTMGSHDASFLILSVSSYKNCPKSGRKTCHNSTLPYYSTYSHSPLYYFQTCTILRPSITLQAMRAVKKSLYSYPKIRSFSRNVEIKGCSYTLFSSIFMIMDELEIIC